jgi:hypothetical protein
MSTNRSLIGGIAACLVLAALPTPVRGQTTSTIPRTGWGAPDLGGVWDYNTLTPLERPSELEGREFLTDEEIAEAVSQSVNSIGADHRPADTSQDIESAYNAFWSDTVTNISADQRTSLIVDPPDGKLPPLTAAAQEREASWRATWQRPIRVPFLLGMMFTNKQARGPEDFGLSERCIVGYSSGPPLMPGAYNSNLQVFQTPDHVVLFTEMVHTARVVPLDERPPLSPAIAQWNGDSRGQWDGDTLVIDSTNFSPKRASFNIGILDAVGSGETLHLTERLTRIDADTLRYQYTVKDARTFTRPFTAIQTLRKTDGPLFEYACHEGNYGLYNMLAGARAEEHDAATTAPGASR